MVEIWYSGERVMLRVGAAQVVMTREEAVALGELLRRPGPEGMEEGAPPAPVGPRGIRHERPAEKAR